MRGRGNPRRHEKRRGFATTHKEKGGLEAFKEEQEQKQEEDEDRQREREREEYCTSRFFGPRCLFPFFPFKAAPFPDLLVKM